MRHHKVLGNIADVSSMQAYGKGHHWVINESIAWDIVCAQGILRELA